MSACMSSPAWQHGQTMLFLQKLYSKVIMMVEKLCLHGRVSLVGVGGPL